MAGALRFSLSGRQLCRPLPCSNRPALAHPVQLGGRNRRRSPIREAAVAYASDLQMNTRGLQLDRGPRPSLDPEASSGAQQQQGECRPGGGVWCIHSPEELQQIQEKYSDRLIVLMSKASHCRPCKMFGRKYSRMSERFSDSVLLEIIGDETNETKKMMISLDVRVTPSFNLWRGTQPVGTATGTDESKLARAILQHLTATEAGYLEERLEEAAEGTAGAEAAGGGVA